METREGCVREQRKRGGVGKKEGGKYDAFSRRREKKRPDDFPSGVSCGG